MGYDCFHHPHTGFGVKAHSHFIWDTRYPEGFTTLFKKLYPLLEGLVMFCLLHTHRSSSCFSSHQCLALPTLLLVFASSTLITVALVFWSTAPWWQWTLSWQYLHGLIGHPYNLPHRMWAQIICPFFLGFFFFFLKIVYFVCVVRRFLWSHPAHGPDKSLSSTVPQPLIK